LLDSLLQEIFNISTMGDEVEREAVSDTRQEETGSVSDTRQVVKQVVDTTKEKLRQIKGQVFHVVAGNNQLLRLRVGTDGKISLEKKIRSLNLESLVSVPKRVLEAGKEAREKLEEVGKEARGQATRKWRKVVTGDPEKRIRDHMKEVPQVKMVDKLSFTFGVLCICGTEWLALRYPSLFPWYYYIMIGMLLANRFYTYSQDNYQLFMLDFCYFINLSVITQTWLFPDNIGWYKANYILCMGPLMCAIIVWKNSLVFHSLDKLTSFFIHAFPPLTMHLLRWGLIPNNSIKPEDSLSASEALLLPLGLYICWQIAYWIITEGILKEQLQSDPTLITSLRYLANDKKNSFRSLCLKLLVWLKVSYPHEEFDAESLKAKVTFAAVQMVYTLITFLPTSALYSSYRFSCVYLVILYSWGTWNGASYYIEVFAERYRLQFKELDDEHDASKESVSAESEEDEDSDDDFQNAVEEIDQSSELYKTIVAAIIKENKNIDDKFSTLETHEDCKQELRPKENEEVIKDDSYDQITKVPELLEEAATESIGKRSSGSSESNGGSSESNGGSSQWEELEASNLE